MAHSNKNSPAPSELETLKTLGVAFNDAPYAFEVFKLDLTTVENFFQIPKFFLLQVDPDVSVPNLIIENKAHLALHYYPRFLFLDQPQRIVRIHHCEVSSLIVNALLVEREAVEFPMWLFLDPEYSMKVFDGTFFGQWEKKSLHERFVINSPVEINSIHLGVPVGGWDSVAKDEICFDRYLDLCVAVFSLF